MTDMRGTERLLEVTAEHVDRVNKLIGDLLLMNVPGSLDDLEVLKARDALDEATEVVVELRRRGDTLVHAEDLRIALRHLGHAVEEGYDGPAADAYRRLISALGGVL
jgi:hypothetical protein